MASCPDLPPDLLGEVSRRLHAADDFVRFHAVCKPWRDAVPQPQRYPAFLPWLLAPRDDDTGHRKASSVDLDFSSSSSKSSPSRCGSSSGAMRVRDMRWLISAYDGAAVYLLDSSGNGGSIVDDPLTWGATCMPSCSELSPSVNHTVPVGGVSGDGTIFLHSFNSSFHRFNVALLRPGETEWTTTMGIDYWPSFSPPDVNHRSVAYRDGKMLVCIGIRAWVITTAGEHAAAGAALVVAWKLVDYDKLPCQFSYVLESRGELLWVAVYNRTGSDGRRRTRRHEVIVWALNTADATQPPWVWRQAGSLADRVMFLGRPSSFAVDAARYGSMSGGGGCAYFVDGKEELEWSRVFRYKFEDLTSELVEQLPAAEWKHDACLWVTPQPAAIASTKLSR